jgi:hypothetical protein
MSPDPVLEPTVPGQEPEEVDEGEESDEYEVEVCRLFSDISGLVLIFCASKLAHTTIVFTSFSIALSMFYDNRAKKKSKAARPTQLELKKTTRKRRRRRKRKEVPHQGYV